MDDEEELNQLRKRLAPALPAFRAAVAARRATGATDEDMEAMLAKIEADMRSLQMMNSDQISVMMKIYREELEAVTSLPQDTANTCRECKQPVIEIDNRGQHLTGCMTCNIWWSADDEKVRLSEEDLAALHELPRNLNKPPQE